MESNTERVGWMQVVTETDFLGDWVEHIAIELNQKYILNKSVL